MSHTQYEALYKCLVFLLYFILNQHVRKSDIGFFKFWTPLGQLLICHHI